MSKAIDTHSQGNRRTLGRVNTKNDHFSANAHVGHYGTVNFKLNDHASKLSKYLEKTARRTKPNAQLGAYFTSHNKKTGANIQSVLGSFSGIPKINIAIHIVGSRGDVQPFIAIAKELINEPYGHRVRICTHPVFKDFVEENGLEFFSIGGDPAELMSYMVRNPGLMPGMESIKAGDVGKRRSDIGEMLQGCWRSCIEPGNGMRDPVTKAQLIREVDTEKLFVADAIIANPPSYAHIHIAERLGIPLHMIFTMPWSPTQQFPHPLANLDSSNSDPNFANYVSYSMTELLAWQGLGDVINGFRVRTLSLDPISPLWGHMLLSRMRVPFTYCWSQALIPKPSDWGAHINISGFSFLDKASDYDPPKDLVEFLDAGDPPVYIGFGSIVIDDPSKLTDMIFGAVKRTGVRALVSKGWGNLGQGKDVPDNVFLLGNVPHDWLFKYVSAVVHHGGAGTTAIGIAMGKPTVVVPFFGDQAFWGGMIYRAGAGPEPIPYKKMTEESLVESIITALKPETQEAVREMSLQIGKENGAADAAKSFHKAINMDTMRCMICPDHVAVWRVKKTNIRLSSLAASVLLDLGILKLTNLKLVRHRNWYIDEGAPDPLLGIVATGAGTVTAAVTLVSDYTKALSRSLSTKKPLKEKSTDASTTSSETAADSPPLQQSTSLDQIPSRNPVQKAMAYSPAHLDWVATQMAHKTLPNRLDRRKHKKSYSWSPPERVTSLLHYPTHPPQYKPPSTTTSSSQTPHGHIHDASVDTGHFMHDMANLGLKVPVALFYNIANGLHNAPSFFFNDDTVRRRQNITGFGSGCRVAGREVVLGVWDGVTGIIYQPYLGAIKGSHRHPHPDLLLPAPQSTDPPLTPDPPPLTSTSTSTPSSSDTDILGGVLGFGKGVGKGFGGLVCKTGAAALGIPGYVLKGLERQLEKRHLRDLKAGMIVVRLKQGIMEFGRSTGEQREDIVRRWRELEERRGLL